MGYLFVFLCAKDVILVGRSDATVALLFLPLVYLSMSFPARTERRAAVHGLVCGVIATAVMLTNWRSVPAVVAVLGIALWTYRKGGVVSRRLTGYYAACYLGASVAICGVILRYFFHFDLGLYYRHFVGFYARGAGWVDSSGGGVIPFGDSYLRSRISFLASLFSPTAWLLIPAQGWSLNRAWGVLSLWVLAFCALAYYLQYYGGGPYYFVPFFILLWFWVCKNSAAMGATRTAVLGIVLLALVGVNYRTVVGPTLRRALGIERAYRFMGTVRSLEETSTVVSEDTFLFRRAFRGESIDMGDTVSAFRRTGYYGELFNQTVDRQFDRVRRNPPDYIVAGFSESPELKALIDKRYALIAEGPHNLTANGGRTSKLFKRKDPVVD